jgi:hypothetical protein
MPESKTEIKYNFDEILELIEKHWGSPLEATFIDIKESGHPDTGNYKRAIKSITFKEIKK